jgi:2-polyprenyl-6-methoxyphenol hydroxylase-like FAD-dependent oxidoreductase
MSNHASVDILIVGAGPVGLFLANECARRGLSFRLIETHASQSEHSKALAIFPRTLEIFDMAGLAGPFLEAANRVTSVRISTHGHTLARMEFAPDETPYRFIAMVPQNVTESLLVEQLRRQGRSVEYETTFVSAVQHADSVSATLDHKGTKEEVTAAFMIGCDGAHSAVRHLLNLSFEGSQYDDLFMLADVESNETLPADELQLCPSELGPVAVFPMSAKRRRIVATIANADGDAPSLELVQSILRQRAPIGLEARALHWSSYFRVHHRQVSSLRTGRIFIAGDAAHIHSPFGGQGMNTGLHDVWNLVWKLDIYLHGWGTEELLESYTAERTPVIKEVIKVTHRLTTAMGTHNKLAQALRDTIIPMASHLTPFQHAFVQRLSALDISYRGSPIIDGEGKRYFDDSLRGGSDIRSRFLLMLNDGADPSVAEAAKQLAGKFAGSVELRAGGGRELALVRPDGYLAYSAGGHYGMDALESARSILERQTRPGAEASNARWLHATESSRLTSDVL